MLLKMALFHSFKCNTALCVCVYIYIHTHTHICDIFFICLSVDGHLSCFHVLATIDSAAVNIGVHVFF